MSEPLVIVGNGMAAARLCEELAQRALGRYAVAVIGEEPRLAYNRVLLSSVLAGEIAANDISLKPASWWSDRGVTLGAVAQIGNAFGMKVIAWSRNLQSTARLKWARHSSLETKFSERRMSSPYIWCLVAGRAASLVRRN